MWGILRTPSRLAADNFKKRNSYNLSRFGIRPSPAAILGMLMTSGMNMKGPAHAIMMALRLAYLPCVGKTTLSFNGKKVWMWIFYDPATGNAMFVMWDSREKDVVEEVLGKNWKGIVVCDGWRAYKHNRKQRRCAHTIAEIRNTAQRNPESDEAAQVYESLQEIYRIGTQASGTKEQRQTLRNQLHKRTRRLIDGYRDGPIPGGFMGKLGRAYDDLFRFVTDPRVPPTNNAAERGLREIVAHGKIRGSMRSEGTMEWLGNLFTCATAWQNRGLDFSVEVAAYL